MTHLTEQFHVPAEYHEACNRLTTLVQRHASRLLKDEYWDDTHLNGLQDHSGQSYVYIRDDEYDAFYDVDAYVYSRFKRCVYHRVTHILDAHADEFEAFQFITDTVKKRKIRSVGWHRIRQRLFDDPTSPYIEWGIIESVVEQLNTYYDRHGCFPIAYTDLVNCPEPNGTLRYAPDKGDHHIHDVAVEGGDVEVVVNAPDSLTPDSYQDWTEHEIQFSTHTRFHEMLDAGDRLGAPTLHESAHGYTIDLPITIPEADIDVTDGRVLAVDLGVKKQATVVPVDATHDGTHEQIAPPTFLDHHAKDKLFRLKADAEGINDRLAELRRQAKAHTDRFDHLLNEYRQTRRTERRLRQQIQHDIANQLVWLAVEHECEVIVFESLGRLEARGTGGKTAWSISSWARGDLYDDVAYKAELVGVDVERVHPWGTSRYCPRCGEKGRTVKAPNDHTECRHGGHFHCPSCGYECDRDVVGAVNVGRKHVSDCKMEVANPAEYISAGKHASFPSHVTCARSEADTENVTVSVSGVQSTPDTLQQGSVSGCQTQLSQYRSSRLTAKRGGTDTGGLQQNHGGKTGVRSPSGSITRCMLTSIAGNSGMLLTPTEN